MKKTKIIIPAMGMLLLSTAASISGSLAWFTANRSVQVNTNSFAVESTDGSLSVEATAGTATTVESGVVYAKVDSENIKLTDASYDITADKLYTDIVKDDGTQPSAASDYELCPEGWAVPTASGIYYGASFNLAFTYTFRGDLTNMDLFFDLNSSVTNNPGEGELTKHTYNGFRMAFVAAAGGEKFVWAPNRASSVEGVNKHLTEGIVETTYAAGEIAYSNTPKTLYNDGVASNATTVNHLGVLTSTVNTLNVKCVVWYEGTDPDVINDATMDNVAATLKFYVRRAA